MSKLSLKNNHKHVSFEDFPILQNARLELTYCDSINLIQFSIFKIKISPPSQKITIPKYNRFHIPKQRNKTFSAAIKSNLNIHASCFMRTVLFIKTTNN